MVRLFVGFRAEAALAEVSEEHEKSMMMTAARATTVFTAAEIRVACDGFSPKKLIGRGVSPAVAGRDDAQSGRDACFGSGGERRLCSVGMFWGTFHVSHVEFLSEMRRKKVISRKGWKV